MINFQFNAGEVVVGTLVGIIGWFIKKEIVSLHERADKMEQVVFNLAGDVQKILGMLQISRSKQ